MHGAFKQFCGSLASPQIRGATLLSANMQSILQILKLNEVREGVSQKNGKPYRMQDAECLILKETGEVDQVGVLQIPRDLLGTVTPGVYLGSFALRPNMASRRIEAQLTGLQPYTVKGSPVAAPAAPVKG